MIDLTNVSHHPAVEEIVEVLCNKTQNSDKGFYRAEVAYFLAKMAATMRATILTKDRGEVPVNIYATLLAGSGYGKGFSINIMELEFLKGFMKRFLADTFPVLSERNHYVIANERAVAKNSDPAEEFEKVQKEDKRSGKYIFTFDSGTPPAIKQLRHKLLLANCGSINLQIDEIGLNLIGSTDILTLFLELYDQGLTKSKLVKNTNENERNEDVDGKTPTNMLLFGTPSKLFDGGQTEDQFHAFLETGYARRCLFAFGQQDRAFFYNQSPEELYDTLASPNNDAVTTKWAQHFHALADPNIFGWTMVVERDVGIELIRYKRDCEVIASALPEHEATRKAEVSHRYFKALKLAGAYAFVDQSNEIEMIHLHQAIKLVEESGEAFVAIMSREKSYVRLAKYIATCNEEVTETDLNAALPFFKGGANVRRDLMSLAITWGYKNNIIIKKTYGPNNIEFFTGETLKQTDLGDMIFSYSDNWAYDYFGPDDPVAFDQLHVLAQAPDTHWCNHNFKNHHRAEENVIPGFNMIVLDVDGGISLSLVHELLKEIKFMTYTTKRHTPECNRFRLIIPTNYRLKLDKLEYAELVNDVIAWLPFKATADVDASSCQRSKKWMSHEDGTYHYNTDGALLDILPFIPKTSRNEAYKQEQKAIGSMDNLERWFAQRISSGNRNNQMIKFALALVDGGLDIISVQKQVHVFNSKLENPMDEAEIDNTIMVTVGKRFAKAMIAA